MGRREDNEGVSARRAGGGVRERCTRCRARGVEEYMTLLRPALRTLMAKMTTRTAAMTPPATPKEAWAHGFIIPSSVMSGLS